VRSVNAIVPSDRPASPEAPPNRRFRADLRSTLEAVVVAIILAVVIRTFVIESFVVQGFSMEPTLLNGEHVLVDKAVFWFEPPSDGEVVVLKPPRLDTTEFYIKRVIATAGQTVSMRDGVVFVDGVRQKEPFVRYVGTDSFGPLTVPPHNVFVLGDNRPESEDSRYFGFVPDGNIQGQAFFAFWPPQRLGLIPWLS
jgi:signal peptidase I